MLSLPQLHMKMKCLEKIVAFCEGWTNAVGRVARRLLADLQPDTAESVVRESVIKASDVVDRRQAAPHTQRRREPAIQKKPTHL